VPAPPLVSKELLRKVCEPFFEQMLTALQDALQEQMLLQGRVPHAATQVTSDTFACHGRAQIWTPLDFTFDEESTEAEDCGAFASLLSNSCSEEDTTPNMGMKAHLSLESGLPEESEQASDSEKSIMVCRHWKTKGWCRMESNCKFLHPEHKRGIAAPQACTVGDRNRAACPGMSTGESEMPVAAMPRRKKRGGKNRSNQVSRLAIFGDRDFSMSQFSGCSAEPDSVSVQCTNFV
jgi:hypothetical protein